MRKTLYEVRFGKHITNVKAESIDEARQKAIENFRQRGVDLSIPPSPGELDTSAIDMAEPFKVVSIYWNDLTPEKQAEILEAFGDNCNFDVVPITELPVF